MNLDTLRAKAEAAKAWRPVPSASCESIAEAEVLCCQTDAVALCDACLGAQRAVEDIADCVTGAMDEFVVVFVDSRHPMKWDHSGIVALANRAARTASYFASEPNPVSEFRDAVKEACK